MSNDQNCCFWSPIVIDISDNGFNLTDSRSGVMFDRTGNGSKVQIAWTQADSDDSWLALDLNGNGVIDDGRELFGSASPQPLSPDPNGFKALAEYDKPAKGGNASGIIDQGDAVFARLALWRDRNHDGLSQVFELSSLSSVGVVSIDLRYHESRWRDAHGNWFRYWARVRDTRGADVGRRAYDVFLRSLDQGQCRK